MVRSRSIGPVDALSNRLDTVGLFAHIESISIDDHRHRTDATYRNFVVGDKNFRGENDPGSNEEIKAEWPHHPIQKPELTIP